MDYETDDAAICESIQQESLKKKPEAPPKGSRRGRKPKAAVKQTADREPEDKIPPGSVSGTGAVTPKKRGRKKKAPVVPDGELPVEERGGGVAENTVDQENGTPKPKLQHVEKKAVQPDKDPPREKDSEEPEEEEAGSGGHRRRRGAAKL